MEVKENATKKNEHAGNIRTDSGFGVCNCRYRPVFWSKIRIDQGRFSGPMI
jgi:hypothetical protein